MARTVERGKRRRQDNDVEEEQPRRRRRQVHNDDDGFDSEPEEDEQPRRRRASKVKDEPRGRKGGSSRKAGGGWGGVDEAKERVASNFTKDFNPPEGETVLVKFFEAEPYDSYDEHWIERGKGKKKSFTCTEPDGEECPLCDVGDKPNAKFCFNVISLEDPDEPKLMRWRTGVTVAEELKDLNDDKRTGPINRDDMYYAVKRSQKSGRWSTTITPVKERDLDAEWDMDPLDEDLIVDLAEDRYDYTSTETQPLSELEEVADEIS